MRHWSRHFFAAATSLLLTGCLWGPGKFSSGLTLHRDGTFALDYRGEIVLQMPQDVVPKAAPWTADMARCYPDGRTELVNPDVERVRKAAEKPGEASGSAKTRPCTPTETAKLKGQYEKQNADAAATKSKETESVAKLFGLPGLDDESNRAFAAKLMKYAGWRSVTYRGHGVFDVDYHFAGSAKQDFVFPALPDNDLLLPFVAIRRRADGAVLVTAPGLTGGAGPLAERMGEMPSNAATDMVSHAEGRFTVMTDGEILTNNSEDGPLSTPAGKQLHWDVNAAVKKIPETLIRLQ